MDTPVTHDAGAHRFRTVVDQHESYLEYAARGNMMVILHTIVPPEVGGRGIAATLVKTALEYARAHAMKVDPQCSYSAAYFKKHPEYADLLA